MSARYDFNLDRVLPEDAADGAPTSRLLRASTPTARRAHPCDICREPILAGEKYRTHVYVTDGDLVQDRTHLRQCWADMPQAEAGQ